MQHHAAVEIREAFMDVVSGNFQCMHGASFYPIGKAGWGCEIISVNRKAVFEPEGLWITHNTGFRFFLHCPKQSFHARRTKNTSFSYTSPSQNQRIRLTASSTRSTATISMPAIFCFGAFALGM